MAAIFSKIDLHCHSTASDGQYTPTDLVNKAIALGITHLALTDHDSVLGVEEAQKAASNKLCLIPGCELSTTYLNEQIHIVGLFVDIKAPSLVTYIEGQKDKRVQRAMAISQKLEAQGIKNAYEECKKLADPNAIITRGNFARYICLQKRAQDTTDAFETYLKKGKSCYVRTDWPDIKDAVNAIVQSGGIAVLAHPNRYQMTATKLRGLIEYFKECGGEAMEVCNCQINPTTYDFMNQLALKYDLYASFGSDFHYDASYRQLGYNLRMNNEVKPVWTCKQAISQGFNF